MIISSKGFSQGMCEGQQVVPIQTFNQCDNNPWVLVFEDNFEGNSLDLSKWNIVTGVPRDMNFEKQKAWHKPDNIVVENGILKIVSKRESQYNMPVVTSWNPYTVKYENFDYTSGEIWTKSTFPFGKIEARIKIPKGKGFWPAFWMFGGSPVYNEIDIFEFWENSTTDHNMTVHYDFDKDGNPSMCLSDYTGVDFSQDFHTFTLIWEKNEIKWYVDGSLKRTDYRYYTISGQIIGCTVNAWGQYVMNKIYPKDPMAIILNTAIETGSKAPNTNTPFPSNLEVDWVRYYQRKPNIDVNITDASQFPLSNQVYNVIVGKDVNINCNFTINSGQQLDIVAKNSITLNAGFSAEAGSVFSARIEPASGTTLKSAVVDNQLDSVMSLSKTDDINSIEKTTDILVYPNPNDGSFVIDFGMKNSQDYVLRITDMTGKIIYSVGEIETATLNLDLSDNPKGTYILYLLNSKSNEAITHKIILK